MATTCLERIVTFEPDTYDCLAAVTCDEVCVRITHMVSDNQSTTLSLDWYEWRAIEDAVDAYRKLRAMSDEAVEERPECAA